MWSAESEKLSGTMASVRPGTETLTREGGQLVAGGGRTDPASEMSLKQGLGEVDRENVLGQAGERVRWVAGWPMAEETPLEFSWAIVAQREA